MTGPQMLLKSLGFDPDEIMGQLNEFRTAVPMFARGLSDKVNAIEARLERIEAKQDEIIRLLHPPVMIAAPAEHEPNGVFHGQ